MKQPYVLSNNKIFVYHNLLVLCEINYDIVDKVMHSISNKFRLHATLG
jgi:hypothetical protein